MSEGKEGLENIITKRIATAADTEFVRELHRRAYHDVVVRQFGSWDDKIQEIFFNRVWIPEKFNILECNGAPCGVTSIYNKEHYIYVEELVILPEFQGQGIGSKVLEEVIHESNQTGTPVRLDVLKENQAQHLYRRVGFKDIDETNTHFVMEYTPESEQPKLE
jgi:ribosomal protein S18 acetylase RimI-like enzyme